MRRSSAPSQLAKKGKFISPLMKSSAERIQSEDIPSPSTASPSTVRTPEDILALFSPSPVKTPSCVTASSPVSASSCFTGKKRPFSSTLSPPLETRKTLHQKENISDISVNVEANERYFSIVWCKRSTRKHKKWEGDAVLIVKSKSVTIKDMEGKVIGQSSGYKSADLESLEDGNTLVVGSKEIEVQGVVSRDSYTSGRCFLSSSSCCKDDEAVPVVIQRPKPKPFILPILSAKTANRKDFSSRVLYATDLPHSLVFPRLSLEEQFSSQGTVEEVVLDPILSSKLRPHQRDGVLFLYKCVTGIVCPVKGGNTGCILADEMGLGKTLQCIALVWTLLKQSPHPNTSGGLLKKVLIVAPSSLVANWAKEFYKWLSKEKISVYAVDTNNKVEGFFKQSLSPVLIISYDMIMRSHHLFSRAGLFDLLICDEAHRLKNSHSKTTSQLAEMPISRRVLLTGTPLQNDLQELFALTDFTLPGILGTHSSFRKVFEEPIVRSREEGGTEEEIEEGQGRVKELGRVTKMFILRRTQDIINKYLPPKVECVVFCSPCPSQVDLYQSVCGLLSRVTHQGCGDEHLAAICLLRKLCNHPALISSSSEVSSSLRASVQELLPQHLTGTSVMYSEEDSGKLAVLSCMLYSLLNQTSEKIVIVSNFTTTLDMIEQLCHNYQYSFVRLDGSVAAVKRQHMVDQFNSHYSTDRVFLLSSKAGGVGLNLIGASRILLYDIDWNPATDLQAMARVWRDGQTRRVYIYRLLLCGSLEERMFQRQVRKQDLSGVVVGEEKQRVGVTFSQQELRDLFSSDHIGDSHCITHSQLNCDCDLTGSNVLHSQENHHQTVRDCQLVSKVASDPKAAHRTMDQLYQWQHYSRDHINYLGDDCLQSATDFINVVFKNESTNLQNDIS